MENVFVSPKNKAMLWDTLYKNNAFSGIDQSRVGELHSLFEIIINEVSENKGDSLLNLNKQTLSLFVERLKQTKRLPSPKIDNTYKDRADKFNKDVIKKKVEFDLHTQPKIPDTIDFRDIARIDSANYNDNDTNLELKLAEMIKSREKLNHTIQFPKTETSIGLKKLKIFQKFDIPSSDIEILETQSRAELYDMIVTSYELINSEIQNLKLMIDKIEI